MVLQIIACLLALAPQDPPGLPVQASDGLASIGWGAAPDKVFWGEEFTLTVEVEIEASVFDGGLAQPFQKALDIPCVVTVPGLGESSSVNYLGSSSAGAESLVFNGAPLGVDRPLPLLINGQLYRRLRIPLNFRAAREGSATLSAPRLNLSRVTIPREESLLGPTAHDIKQLSAQGSPLTVRIEPLPEEGRPLGFTGAVGTFEVWATASKRQLMAGEAFRLTLEVEGSGHLGQSLNGWPASVPGFHIRGRSWPSERRLELELAPSNGVPGAIPAISLDTFDPSVGSYARIQSEVIPLIALSRPQAEISPGGKVGDKASSADRLWLAGPLLALGVAMIALAFLLMLRHVRSGPRDA